jgi:hypothetical protein
MNKTKQVLKKDKPNINKKTLFETLCPKGNYGHGKYMG